MADVKLTRKARRALKSGKHQLSHGATLMAEVMLRTGPVADWHLAELVEQVLRRYGTAEAAIDAIRRDAVGFQRETVY